MNKNILLLSTYVNSATDLAESLKRDLAKGREVTDKTILYLQKFQRAALAFEDTTNELNKHVMKNN